LKKSSPEVTVKEGQKKKVDGKKWSPKGTGLGRNYGKQKLVWGGGKKELAFRNKTVSRPVRTRDTCPPRKSKGQGKEGASSEKETQKGKDPKTEAYVRDPANG